MQNIYRKMLVNRNSFLTFVINGVIKTQCHPKNKMTRNKTNGSIRNDQEKV